MCIDIRIVHTFRMATCHRIYVFVACKVRKLLDSAVVPVGCRHWHQQHPQLAVTLLA